MSRTVAEKDASQRCIVLLSGGLDSTVSLAMAAQRLRVALCLTFAYGQRSERQEVKSSARLSEHYGAPHQVIDLPWLAAASRSSLQTGEASPPRPKPEELDDPKIAKETAAAVWVPNRNGVFVNVAAALAEAKGCRFVVTGFNAEEAATFPDNSQEFVRAANRCFSLSTLRKVRLISYTLKMTKTDIVREALTLNAPIELSWSCYEAGERPCGRCESCLRRARAFQDAGVSKR